MFSWVAKKAIKHYWKITPEKDRKVCLFMTSCSRHVYQKIEKKGFFSALVSYNNRLKSCNKDYTLEFKSDMVFLITKYGKKFNESELNPIIVNDFRLKVKFESPTIFY